MMNFFDSVGTPFVFQERELAHGSGFGFCDNETEIYQLSIVFSFVNIIVDNTAV